MSVLTVTNENFDREVVNSEKKVLLDFWASWCGPCRRVAPILEEIAQERDDIIVGKVNVDEESALAGAFQIMSIPTLVVIEKGEVKNAAVGALPKADILRLLD